MSIPFRKSKTSKAATPKKARKLNLAELASSPSTSAGAWKDSFQEGLRLEASSRKSKLALDDTVFLPLLTTPEKELKNGNALEKTDSVLEGVFAIPEVQKESGSGLNVSAGRVSLWVNGYRIG